MAFTAKFPQELDSGRVYDLLHDALMLSDSFIEQDRAQVPRLQVVDCRADELKLDLEFVGGTSPSRCRELRAQFIQEAEQLLRESGESRVRLVR